MPLGSASAVTTRCCMGSDARVSAAARRATSARLWMLRSPPGTTLPAWRSTSWLAQPLA